MIVGLTFMGFDFVADVDYRVLSWGCDAQTYGPPENCYPAEPPEWEIEAITLQRDVPPPEHLCGITSPVFEATGALFYVLSDLDAVTDAIMQDTAEYDGPDDRDYEE